MGDFNFPEINWTDKSTSVSETHIAKLTNFLKILGTVNPFYQHVYENTRYKTGQEPSLLYCIFTTLMEIKASRSVLLQTSSNGAA